MYECILIFWSLCLCNLMNETCYIIIFYQLFKISKVYDIRFQKWARILEFLREASVFCVVYVFLWIKNYIIKIIPFPISSAFKLFDEGVEGLDLHIINCVW